MTSYSDLARKAVLDKPVYNPGKPIEMAAMESGLDPAAILKMASNENPLGASPLGLEAARQALEGVSFYPENSAWFLRQKLAEIRGVHPDQLVIGHGSSEIIHLLCAAFVEPGIDVVMGEHAFIAYKLSTLLHEGNCLETPLVDFRHDLKAMREAVTPQTRLVFLPSPNNPTGTSNSEAEIVEFVRSLPDHVVFCLDEAYAEYLDQPPDLRPLISEGRKVICTRTFSKIYGLAGLRIGYGYGHRDLADLLNRVRPPFNVNSVALAAALGALQDEAFVAKSKSSNFDGMAQLREGFDRLGLEYVPSVGNFILVRFENSDKVYVYLHDRGIIVRPLTGYALPEHLRITVGTEDQNQSLLNALGEFFGN